MSAITGVRMNTQSSVPHDDGRFVETLEKQLAQEVAEARATQTREAWRQVAVRASTIARIADANAANTQGRLL